MKNKFLCSLAFIFLLFPLGAQPVNQLLEDPDDILQKGRTIPKVLLVGSFHFAYYGLDAHVTKEKDRVNVKLPKRQQEMQELVNYIAQFKPTKIAIESGRNTGYIMRRYEKYLADSNQLKVYEGDQIGFRLMKRFGLDTVYGVDAPTLVGSLSNHPDSLVLGPLLDSIYDQWDFNSKDPFDKAYNKYYDRDDQLTLNNDLLSYFKHMNSDKSIDRGMGAYLIGDFKNGTYEGADATAMHWYARNLRIFRNLQNITEPEDRILLIIGAGHLTILKNLFVCSPEYELVRFGALDSE